MSTHRFVLSAGHRNTDRGGARREIDWTYGITKKLKDAIIRRGGKAWIIQEEDGDNDPTFSVGRGLQSAAYLCVDLAKQVGGVDAYISMHYEGVNNPAVRGVFGIFPDSPQGGIDVRANNTIDYALCQKIADHVSRKTAMPKRTGWVVEPGVMSERQTGVGGNGHRLGEFVGTLGFRTTTARVILEGGAISNPIDEQLLWSASWQDAYVEAIVDALEEQFGKFKGSSTPAPGPTPTPAPESKYEAPAPIAGLANRPLIFLDNKAVLVRVNATVTTRRATKRLKYAYKSSVVIGDEIPAGAEFVVDYLIMNPDGSLFWYTPWHTRVAYEDTHQIREIK